MRSLILLHCLLIGLLPSLPAAADEAAAPLQNIRKMWPIPAGALTVNDLHGLQNSALLYFMLIRKYPNEPATKEAIAILESVRGRLEPLKASLLSELPPKEAKTASAVAKAEAVTAQLRKEIKAGGRSGAVPKLRAGTCVALDYGGDPSLYRVVVVRVSRVAPGEAWAGLVFRAKEGDAIADGDAWSRFLDKPTDYEVPESVFAGGLAIPCERGKDLYRRFAAARVTGRSVTPIKENIEKIDQILAMIGGPK